MRAKMKVTAIVPAAGFGTRFGRPEGKTFVPLGGKPVLLCAVETIASIEEVVEVIPVLRETEMEDALELFTQFEIPKVKRIAHGGKERQDSVFHGLSLVEDKSSLVLVHDGVRPLLDPALVRKALGEMADYDGVVLGVPLKDTIKEVIGGEVRGTLQRDGIWAIQTPQIFVYETLASAYHRAKAEGYYSTDDSALVERYGGRVRVVMGSYQNIKITTPEDLVIAEALLRMRSAG